MAIEYAGYVPTTKQVNWESLTDKFAEKVETSISARKEERKALDQIAFDNQNLINKQELGKTQALNEFVTKEGFKGKTFINDLNKQLKAGKITPEEYRRSMNNVTENWGVLANSAKTYDDRRQAIFTRQQADKDGYIAGSKYEVELQELNEEALDLANNSTHWAKNGSLYLGKTDKDGKLIGELNDIRSLNTPENIFVNRVDVNKSVTTFTNEWKANKSFQDVGKEGSITIEDIRLKVPEFNLATLYLAESIAPDSDPRRQISVLVDNGVITPEYYFKDEERADKIEKLTNDFRDKKWEAGLGAMTEEEKNQIKLSLVKLVKKPNGVTDPELTPEQQKAVKDRIILEVEMQFASEETGKAQDVPAVRAPRTPSGDKGDEVRANFGDQTYLQMKRAIDNSDHDQLNTLSLKQRFSFEWNNEKGVYDIYERYNYNDKGDKVFDRQWLAEGKTVEDLAPFVYPLTSKVGDPLEQLHVQRENAKKRGAVTFETAGEKKDVYPWTPAKHAYVEKLMVNNKILPTYKNIIEAAQAKYPNNSTQELIDDLINQGRIKKSK